jgi:glycosyltransferase involved in cell wall biosynthesis
MDFHDSNSQPLSVALVSPGWPARLMANGIVSYTATIAGALTELGVNCQVLTSRPMSDDVEPFVHVIHPKENRLLSKIMWRLSPQGWPNRQFCSALAGKLRRLRDRAGTNLLEIEESYGWARLLSGQVGMPIVVRLHGPWFLNGVANGTRQDAAFVQRDRWERAGIEAASAISAPSQHVLDETRKHFGLPLEAAEVIANPVEPVAAENRWKLEECDRNRIAFVGRFDRHKGGDLALDAFALTAKHFPEARLDFIGPDRGCVDDSGREWKIEEYLAQKLGDDVRRRVKYHGFQPGSTAAEIRKRALVTIAPSRYETFGIATAEAMMAGCPTVVRGSGALLELVQDGKNGLVATPGSAEDLASKVMALISAPQRAAALGHQAAMDAADRYSPSVVAEQTAAFYRRVVYGNRARPSGRAIAGSMSTSL